MARTRTNPRPHVARSHQAVAVCHRVGVVAMALLVLVAVSATACDEPQWGNNPAEYCNSYMKYRRLGAPLLRKVVAADAGSGKKAAVQLERDRRELFGVWWKEVRAMSSHAPNQKAYEDLKRAQNLYWRIYTGKVSASSLPPDTPLPDDFAGLVSC